MSAAISARSHGASVAAIQRHYDVGNEFYALWLDLTRTYSCALWEPGDDLHAAQLRKLDWHLDRAAVGPGKRLLDVGCGWGSLLHRAVATRHVAHATGLSLSDAQVRWVQDLSLPRVEVCLQSWADHVPAELYDAVISIGAFEHFARLDEAPEQKLAGYRSFFEFCHEVLRPGGRLCVQTIVYERADRTRFSPFFAENVFPESDLPHVGEIAASFKGLFELETLREDGSHYERTAREWLMRLRRARAEAIESVGESRFDTYERYLGLLALGFHNSAMNLVRMSLRRIDLPARRER